MRVGGSQVTGSVTPKNKILNDKKIGKMEGKPPIALTLLLVYSCVKSCIRQCDKNHMKNCKFNPALLIIMKMYHNDHSFH